MEKMTIADCFDRFLQDREVYCSPGTIVTYTGHVQIFFRFLEEKYCSMIQELTFDSFGNDNIFNDFVVYLRQKNIRNVTIRSYCRCVKAFLRFCYEEDLCRDYLKRVKLPKDDSVPQMPLFTDEVARINAQFDLETIKGLRNYCIIHLMLDCGLRSQEVRRLQVEHLDSDRNLLYILDSKGNKSRIVLIPDFLIFAIRKYMRTYSIDTGIIFLSLKNGEQLTSNAIKQLFADLKIATGIPRLHAHLLRHTFATSYLLGGGNLEFLRVFMGHSDYNVTKGYSSLAAECKMLGLDVYRLDSIFFTRGY